VAPDARRASGGHRPVVAPFEELSMFWSGGHQARPVTT